MTYKIYIHFVFELCHLAPKKKEWHLLWFLDKNHIPKITVQGTMFFCPSQEETQSLREFFVGFTTLVPSREGLYLKINGINFKYSFFSVLELRRLFEVKGQK
jgi:hypothetical protein